MTGTLTALDQLTPAFTHRPTVQVTVERPITRAASYKTLERLFRKDRAFMKPYLDRVSNFRPQPKRRGGRIWTKRPNQPDLRLDPGATATFRLTPQFRRDLQSVATFVNVRILDTHSGGKTTAIDISNQVDVQHVVVEPRRSTTNTLTPHIDELTILRSLTRRELALAHQNEAILQFGSTVAPVVPIRSVKMIRPSDILHVHMGEAVPADLADLMRTRAISEVYLDVTFATGKKATAQDILAVATLLHDQAAPVGVALHPVVVGPVSRRDHALLHELAQRLIRISPLPYDRYNKQAHLHDAAPDASADRGRNR